MLFWFWPGYVSVVKSKVVECRIVKLSPHFDKLRSVQTCRCSCIDNRNDSTYHWPNTWTLVERPGSGDFRSMTREMPGIIPYVISIYRGRGTRGWPSVESRLKGDNLRFGMSSRLGRLLEIHYIRHSSGPHCPRFDPLYSCTRRLDSARHHTPHLLCPVTFPVSPLIFFLFCLSSLFFSCTIQTCCHLLTPAWIFHIKLRHR
jgi:hypothetical protein